MLFLSEVCHSLLTVEGYFIYTAAVIAYLDPAWLGLNQDWVNTLVRDAANPSLKDTLFPFSRMFDWYHGHSFAKGLFETADSKDEESSSEDAFFSYAIKMWGRITRDASMEARGNLMLSIQARTLTDYFLLQSNNVNQPAEFIGNKVTGIVCIPPAHLSTMFLTLPSSFLRTRLTTRHTLAPILNIFKESTCCLYRHLLPLRDLIILSLKSGTHTSIGRRPIRLRILREGGKEFCMGT